MYIIHGQCIYNIETFQCLTHDCDWKISIAYWSTESVDQYYYRNIPHYYRNEGSKGGH